MENLSSQNQENKPDITEPIKSMLRSAPDRIETEYNNGSNNPWLACVTTVNLNTVFKLSMLEKTTADEDKEKVAELKNKILKFDEKVRGLQNTYHERGDDSPPAEIKSEILEDLEQLAA